MYQLSTVVLEDDDQERLALVDKLKGFPMLNLVGEAASADEAYWLLTRTRPAAIFADIKLIGNDVFSVFERLQKEGITVPPTVIITAFPDYAQQTLNDYRQQVVKFLRKPFEENWQQQLGQAIDALMAAQAQVAPPAFDIDMHFYENFRQVIATLTAGQVLQNPADDPDQPVTDHLYIEDRGTYYRIDFDKIIYIEIPEKSTTHIIQDIPSYEQRPKGEEAIYKPVTIYEVEWSLANLLKKLPPDRFQKISRNCIVNLARIRRVYRENQTWRIEMLVGAKMVWRIIEPACHRALMKSLDIADKKNSDSPTKEENRLNVPGHALPVVSNSSMNGLPQIAVRIDLATIMICQLQEPSGLAERGEPEDFIEEVALCFQRFDDIIANHHLERINTLLYHRYLCTGGLVKGDQDHTRRVVQAAIEMQQFLTKQQAERKKKHLQWFELCIGIHSGPVLMQAQPFYRLWGGTLNEATRIEYLGAPGKITLSAQAHQHVQYDFGFQCIKRIDAQSGTEVNVYQVIM